MNGSSHPTHENARKKTDVLARILLAPYGGGEDLKRPRNGPGLAEAIVFLTAL